MRYTALVLCIIFTLSACGLKGPLYLPEPATKPAPQTPVVTEETADQT